MPPVYVKGGLWTNVEDEILKAAIAKYGLNQWSRVSSLLTRKNAKQCKLRWQEWLDPRIRKHDWSPEEDRQLLNLAKLRPNQWSSISLQLNRTANQCIERYQELLSQVDLDPETDKTKRILLTGNLESGKAQGASSVGSSLGGLNLNPESKPARPDLTIMDEDEQEMISEARARLANTQGKKAKRKAREKILEESRRVAELLRRRELKQVGIDKGLKVKKTFKEQMDYNADIAFERRPQQGPFDTAKELELDLEAKRMFDKNTDVKGTFNQEIEAQKRKERKRRQQNKKLAERSNVVKSATEEVDALDDSNFVEEFSKRRTFVFHDNVEASQVVDIDNVIGKTAEEQRIRSDAKLGVLSRKRLNDEFTELTEDKADRESKSNEKKRRKELKKQVMKLLNSLPPAEDDFEVDVNVLLEDRDNVNYENISVTAHKPSKHHIIVDQTEKRRIEKEKVQNLKAQLQEFSIPQSVRLNLPAPISIPEELRKPPSGPMKPLEEIEFEMARMIVSKSGSAAVDMLLTETKGINVEEGLVKQIRLFSEVNEKIDAEIDQIREKVNYETLIDKEIPERLTQDQLVKIIKNLTKESVDMESRFKVKYEQFYNENGCGHLLSDIKRKEKELLELNDEIWAYEQFKELEAEAIDSRKSRIQKDLDYVNVLIEKIRSNEN